MNKTILVTSILWALSVLILSSCGSPSNQNQQSTDNNASSSKVETTAKKYKWKLITTWPKNFPALGMGPERFAKMVDKMSNGRLKIKVYGANELVPALEVFDNVANGTAEMGHGAAYYWKGKIPVAQLFTTVPYGLTAQEMNGWLHHGGGMELWQELYEPHGVIPFAMGNSLVQMGGWFNKEINSVDDLKGLKMRIPGLGGEVLKRAGGTPVLLPGSELLTSLQTGAIDATEWVGAYNDMAFGLHKLAKYYYYPGWHEPGAVLEGLVNKKAFESLPEDLQEIVKAATRVINQDMSDEFIAQNSNALQILKEKNNIELRAFPPDVLAKLREISGEVVAEIASHDEISRRIYESYKAYKDSVRELHDITEKAFINAR